MKLSKNSEAMYLYVLAEMKTLREVMEGSEGILENILKKILVIVDHTTSSADIAREYNSSKCIKKNKFFLDAPISGGQVGAENGQLSIMVGGR